MRCLTLFLLLVLVTFPLLGQDTAAHRNEKVKLLDLVEQFNTMHDEGRLAEAEIIALQIENLVPDSPISRLVKVRNLVARRMKSSRQIAATGVSVRGVSTLRRPIGRSGLSSGWIFADGERVRTYSLLLRLP